MFRAAAFPHATSNETAVDGAPFQMRPIRVDDAARERSFIDALSDASRYSRLMHAVREPSAAFINQMVTIDHRRTMAFVAVTGEGDEEEIIGVARYAGTAEGSECEFAIVVADPWQSRGVGTRLAHRLIRYARTQGVLVLRARILSTNSRMANFARRLGFKAFRMPAEPGLLDARLPLTAIPVSCPPSIVSDRQRDR